MFQVSIRYQQSYILEEVRKKLETILTKAWGHFPQLKNGDRILLKPNLLSGKPPEIAVTTHPIVLEAMIQLLLDAGCKITIGTDWHLPGFFKKLLRWVLLPLTKIDPHLCKGCLDCQKIRPSGAIYLKGNKVSIKEGLCIRCYCCQEVCPENAIRFKKRKR